jgi:hypothetical protein
LRCSITELVLIFSEQYVGPRVKPEDDGEEGGFRERNLPMVKAAGRYSWANTGHKKSSIARWSFFRLYECAELLGAARSGLLGLLGFVLVEAMQFAWFALFWCFLRFFRLFCGPAFRLGLGWLGPIGSGLLII